jgi:methionyl-tRNA synthetase
MKNQPFYITTPIYYVNDEPHLGHAYTTILADVLARYARLNGRDTFFLTGTDEHGQKVAQAAQRRGISPQQQADEMVVGFQQAWQDLHINYDDFFRTTETRHKQVVTAVLDRLWQQGEIYRGQYVGWYCVPDERFWTEKELVNGRCPDCGRPVEQIEEANYFFRMSAYQEWLIEYIQSHPEFIQPDNRRNEVLGFLRQPLGDLCISRPVSRLNWGIPLPFDNDYVTYVWFDALLNYVTAVDYLTDESALPTLLAPGHPSDRQGYSDHPRRLLADNAAGGRSAPAAPHFCPRLVDYGWPKMGKSLGNAVKPLDLAGIIGPDALRYFLMREMSLGRDAEFSAERIFSRYEADLANDLGNLLHRLLAMVGRYHNGRWPQPNQPNEIDTALREKSLALIPQVLAQVEAMAVNEALAGVMTAVSQINVYLEQTSPWLVARSGDLARVGTILYHAAEALRLLSLLLQPVLPERMGTLWQQLGWQPPENLADGLQWGLLRPDTAVQPAAPLFPRLRTGRGLTQINTENFVY